MKLFIPAVGYRIKLTNEWKFNLYYEHRNLTLLDIVVPGFDHQQNKYIDGDYKKGLKHVEASLPANTLLEVDRVYVRTMNKSKEEIDDYDSVTFRVINENSKAKVRFWARLNDVNNLEYELPVDYAASKVKAQENAKKPKKLTPERAANTVASVIRDHYYRGNRLRTKSPTPVWFTAALIEQFKLVTKEYERLKVPCQIARHEKQQKQRLDELKRQFAEGTLSLPHALAQKVKTFDDLRALGYYKECFTPFEKREQFYDWTSVIAYELLQTHQQVTKTFERLPDGTCCRTFRRGKPDTSQWWNEHEPSLEHLWVKVYSDAADLEVTNVEAGIDPLV